MKSNALQLFKNEWFDRKGYTIVGLLCIYPLKCVLGCFIYIGLLLFMLIEKVLLLDFTPMLDKFKSVFYKSN